MIAFRWGVPGMKPSPTAPRKLLPAIVFQPRIANTMSVMRGENDTASRGAGPNRVLGENGKGNQGSLP